MRDDLSEDTYTVLATDDAMLVRDAIRENQACSAEIRALAALGSL
jgi:peptide subunit release factor RF-3